MLIVKGLLTSVFQVALFAALLLVPAGLLPKGTWFWPRGLAFLGAYALVLGATVVWLGVKAPASLEARVRAPLSKKQPPADRVATVALMLALAVWFVSIPVDVFALKLAPPPHTVISAAGGLAFLVGFAIIVLAAYQNSFAIPVVEDQSEAGQVLVDTGLYGRVRHPLYSGLMLYVTGISLFLESYASLLLTVPVLLALVARILIEEKTLHETLPGYGEYAERVRARLVPYLW